MLDQSRNKIERYTSDRKMAETKQADIWVKYMKKKKLETGIGIPFKCKIE